MNDCKDIGEAATLIHSKVLNQFILMHFNDTRKVLLGLFMSCVALSTVDAQASRLNLNAVAGGSDAVAGIQLNWTLGEIAIAGNTRGAMMFTEGFQQPYLQKLPTNTFEDIHLLAKRELVQHDHIAVYPNPVHSLLTIHIPHTPSEVINLTLYHMNGVQVMQPYSTVPPSNIQVDVTDFTSGIYLLRVTDRNNQVIQSFTISKI